MTPTRGAKWRRHPPERLPELSGDDVCTFHDRVWRIMRTSGRHAVPWNHLRSWGPLQHMRWDPHDAPASDQPDRAVMYGATDVLTAVAEVFQHDRYVDVHSNDPYLIGFTPIRGLQLLDLSGTWLLRCGATASQTSAPRTTCREWARAIAVTYPHLDGLWVRSSMTNRPVVVLFAPARSALPSEPEFSRALATGDTRLVVQAAATEIGYAID